MMTNSYANPPAKVAMCKACHGEKGAKPIMDTYPKIAGQNKGYLAGVLKEYRAGKRSGGQAAVMSAQAKNLTDAEIDSLAEFYSKQ
ncbi:MAG: c-type cytochrome [Gammaproteobacteria bacterium]|nr:c-type cytochrome [Gammaproteobacteria bacterium]